MTCARVLAIEKLRLTMQDNGAVLGGARLSAAIDEFDQALLDLTKDFQLLVRVGKYLTCMAGKEKCEYDQLEKLHRVVSSRSVAIRALMGEMEEGMNEPPKQPGLQKPVQVQMKAFDDLEPTVPEEDGWTSSENPSSGSQPSVWSGFYNKTLRERFDVLSLMYPRLTRMKGNEGHDNPGGEATDPVSKLGELPLRTANLMIENCVGVLGVPLGLGLNFVVDGRHFSVPMAVEEPSVVAAASSAAKLISAMGGGFRTATTGNIMTSQIQLIDVPDMETAIKSIGAHRERLLDYANTSLCPSMKKRGGGAVDIYCRIVKQATKERYTQYGSDDYWYTPCKQELSVGASDGGIEYLVVHIDVDVCEAMGANIVNTVAEGLSSEVSRLTGGRCGLRILTNLCMQRRTRAVFEIPVEKLGWKGVAGSDVADRIIDAYNFAAVDPYRAVTNNKGIMNGVDAVALATGQDWRAIEAAAHCYASRSGQYSSLSHYEIGTSLHGKKVLRGSLELPISVGSKGGALQTHPGYAATHTILNQPTSKCLSRIMVSVGLAQNFAAVRAIAITGIQKGHMALHARNIAVAAGAPSELVSELCSYMLGRKSINMETAKEYLQAHAIFSEIRSNSPPVSPSPVSLPSMFYVEIPVPHLEEKLSLNIAFESINKHPQYIAIVPNKKPSSEASSEPRSIPLIQQQLLGDKGYNQLEKMFMFLASMRSVFSDGGADAHLSPRANLALQNKLQLLSILLNIIAYRLMEVRPDVARQFFGKILALRDGDELDVKRHRALLAEAPADDEVLSTGLPLFVALWQVLHYHIDQEVPQTLLRVHILREQWRLLDSIVRSFDLKDVKALENANQNTKAVKESFASYMHVQSKRWQATMFLLIDSLALQPDFMSPEKVSLVAQIGKYMEWEGTVAHDVARFQRARSEGTPNSFLYWIRLHGLGEAQGEDYVCMFRQMAQQIGADMYNAILAQRDSPQAKILSMEAINRVVQLIRDIYRDRDGLRPRKESF